MIKTFKALLMMILLSAFHNESPTVKQEEQEATSEPEIPAISYQLLETFPHDTTSYTQGLFFSDGKIFESTGAPLQQKQTRSLWGILDLKSGKINIKAELDRNKYFGEGLTLLKSKIYQLTWKNQIGFIYDAKTFRSIGTFVFKNTEGWGLTTDGDVLIMSDGTNNLSFIEPGTFKLLKTLPVTNKNYPENYLNELEFINGFIYANVYQRNYIVKIDPKTGKVIGILDLSPLDTKAKRRSARAEVLNGIAYDPLSKKVFVTGKLWPELYVIELK